MPVFYMPTLRTYDIFVTKNSWAERIGAVSARSATEARRNASVKYGVPFSKLKAVLQ